MVLPRNYRKIVSACESTGRPAMCAAKKKQQPEFGALLRSSIAAVSCLTILDIVQPEIL